jgi:MinD-like ATPase involved in chromosome partitioning or flagellar assembly
MTKIISVHSFRGGTGKTLVSANLAAIYASEGNNICLLDLDFRAPSLYSLFELEKSSFYLNDYLNGSCDFRDALVDVTQKYHTKGNFLVSAANPDINAIQEMSMKDRKWEMTALHRLVSLKTGFFNDENVNYGIFDTSPGVQYSSINALASSDLAIMVTTLDKSDLKGTSGMISRFNEVFEKKTLILANKVPCETPSILQSYEKDKLLEELTTSLGSPILGAIPCYCDVLRQRGRKIFALEMPGHPFVKELAPVAEALEAF